MNKKFYVVSPDKEKISTFVKKFLNEENKEGFVNVSNEMINPSDSLKTYILINKDDIDWYEYYMENSNDTHVFVG